MLVTAAITHTFDEVKTRIPKAGKMGLGRLNAIVHTRESLTKETSTSNPDNFARKTSALHTAVEFSSLSLRRRCPRIDLV